MTPGTSAKYVRMNGRRKNIRVRDPATARTEGHRHSWYTLGVRSEWRTQDPYHAQTKGLGGTRQTTATGPRTDVSRGDKIGVHRRTTSPRLLGVGEYKRPTTCTSARAYPSDCKELQTFSAQYGT